MLPGLHDMQPLQYYKSSYVRELIRQGKPYAEYMPEEVYKYINKNGLYK